MRCLAGTRETIGLASSVRLTLSPAFDVGRHHVGCVPRQALLVTVVVGHLPRVLVPHRVLHVADRYAGDDSVNKENES